MHSKLQHKSTSLRVKVIEATGTVFKELLFGFMTFVGVVLRVQEVTQTLVVLGQKIVYALRLVVESGHTDGHQAVAVHV